MVDTGIYRIRKKLTEGSTLNTDGVSFAKQQLKLLIIRNIVELTAILRLYKRYSKKPLIKGALASNKELLSYHSITEEEIVQSG